MYNYYEAMTKDVKDYVKNYVTFANYADVDELRDALNDDLWTVDDVTGNASGSYTFSAHAAAAYALCDNRDLLIDALEAFGDNADSYRRALEDPEYADVSIRCYLLSQIIDAVLDEWDIADYYDAIDEGDAARADEIIAAVAAT